MSLLKKLLIIGYVWPERTSSAAGLRTWNLIESSKKTGWEVFFASASASNPFRDELEKAGLRTFEIQINDRRFDTLLEELSPDAVIFDRFVVEEQFGWRVRDVCPDALRVLDTQDLHFLRRARKAAVESGISLEQIFRGEIDLISQDTLRELASIYRSDLTFVLSDFEKELLLDRMNVSKDLIAHSLFFYPRHSRDLAGFKERRNFVMIGNFRHPPNKDGLIWFRKKIWPKIRKKLPSAEVHLYGAYPPKDVMDLTERELGFVVKGWVEDHWRCLESYRINLAPLRYGAGIKGKISDGWRMGTPVITTPIGAEGMAGELAFGGRIAWNEDEFVESALELYLNEEKWLEAHSQSTRIIQELYSEEKGSLVIQQAIQSAWEERDSRRRANLFGRVLELQQFRSTKYFSKWIEEKNLNRQLAGASGDSAEIKPQSIQKDQLAKDPLTGATST